MSRYVVILIISTSCEAALVGVAILTGAPVGALIRGAARRGANAIILCAFALGSWIAASLVIQTIVRALPNEGQSGLGNLRVDDTNFNLAILVPMIVVSAVIAALLMPSLVAAARGRALRACLMAATRVSAR